MPFPAPIIIGQSNVVSQAATASPSRTVSDAISAVSDAAPVRLVGRPIGDAISAVSDLLATNRNRPLADTISAVSDLLATLRNRVISDTLSSVNGSAPTAQALHPRAASDAISAVSDALATNRNRVLSDALSAVNDGAPSRSLIASRALSEALSAVSDTVKPLVNRPLADTISAVSDALGARTVGRVASDALSALSDVLATNRNRVLTDALVTPSDTVVGARSYARTVSDAISTVSDTLASLRNRVISDAISAVSETTPARKINRVLSDAISAVSDSVQGGRGRTAADTLTSFAESIVTNRNRVLADAISTVSDTLTHAAGRKAADTLTTIVDTVATVRNRVLTDNISAVSDALLRKIGRVLSEALVTPSDSVSAVKSGGGVAVADTLVAMTDTVKLVIARFVSDAISTVSDALTIFYTRTLIDALVGRPSYTLLVSGNEITDVTRTTDVQGDGYPAPDSSYWIGQASTNLCRNGGAETNLTGHAGFSGGLVTRVLGGQQFGSACFDIDATAGSGRGDRYSDTTSLPAAGETWTASVFVVAKTGADVGKTVQIVFTTRTTGETVSKNIVLTAAYQRVQATLTVAGAGATGYFIDALSVGSGVYFLADGFQAEKKPYATPYIHTDGGSASRGASNVRGPAEVLSEAQGWVALRLRMGWASGSALAGFPLFYGWDNTPAAGALRNQIGLYVASSGQRWSVDARRAGTLTTCNAPVGSGNFVDGDPATVIVSWTDTQIRISVNGAVFTAVTRSGTAGGDPLPLTFGIGGVAALSQGDSAVKWFAAGLGVPSNADAAALNAYGDTDPTFSALPANPTLLWKADTAQTVGLPMDVLPLVPTTNRVIFDTLSSFSDVTKWSYTRVASDALVTMTDSVSITTAGVFTRAVSDVLVTMVDTTIGWRRPPGRIGGTLTRGIGPVSSLVKVSGASSTLAKRAGPTSLLVRS